MALKGKMKNTHPFWQLLVWVVIMATLTLAMMTGFMAYTHTTGGASINSLRCLQAMQALCLFILPALAAAYLWSDKPMARLALNRGFSVQVGLLAVLLIVVAQPGINLISWWNESWNLPDFLGTMEDNTNELTKELAYSRNVGMLLVNILVMAVLPGLGEEICFRGVLLGERCTQNTTSVKTHLWVWVVAILFSSIHMQFAGFLPRMLLGAILGYLLVWSCSLWLPILVHSVNNAFVVVMYYLGDHTSISAESIDEFGRGNTWWVGVISIVLTLALLWWTQSVSQKQSATPRRGATAEG